MKWEVFSKMIVLLFCFLSLATSASPKGSKNKQIHLDSSLQTVHNLHQDKPGIIELELEDTDQKKNEATFSSPAEKLKWRLNNARKKLIIAKDYLKLAEKISKKKKDTQSTNAQQASVRDIIRKAEIQVLNTGEKMGLAYVHYKRNII